jgi:dynein light chain Tctex-type 1
MSEVYEFNGIATQGTAAVKSIISKILNVKKYNAAKTPEWTDEITSSCIDKMKEISTNFKFIVSCVIAQRKGAGVHMETATHWDTKTDGNFVVREENDSMIIVVTVYGLGL